MNFISIIIYVIISLAVGIGLIGISLNVEYLDITTYLIYLKIAIAQNLPLRIATFLTGALIILIFLRFIQKGMMRYRREKTIKTETDEGFISVTLTAIEDMIKKTLAKEDIIFHIKPKIFATRREIVSNIKIALKEAVNLKEFAENIQAKLKGQLHAILGDEKPLKINIEVKKIAFSKKEAEDFEEEDEEGPLRSY